MRRLVVIGGGIAGLSAAYYLQKKLGQQGGGFELTLAEAGDYWGGKISTYRQNGFVIEGGPDTFLATKPWAVNLCRELGLEGSLQGTNQEQRNTFVLSRGQLKPLPDGLMMMIPTRFGPLLRSELLSWTEKARMGFDFFLPARPMDGDESLGEFVSRRLGRAAYEALIEPLMSGIYAGDGDLLSLQSTFPYLRQLELDYGGLVRGALHMRQKMSSNAGRPAGSWSAFLTPKTGLAEIVEALVDQLEKAGARLLLNSPVLSVSWQEDGYLVKFVSGKQTICDGVILAAPAYASGDLLQEFDAGLAQDLRAIPYVSTATVSLAYRQEDLPTALNGYGYVIPRREGRRALACTWTSTKFPHRAPSGYALLRVFIGRAGQEAELPNDESQLMALAMEEMRLTLGIRTDPLLARVYYWDRAMPQYNLGHAALLERIESALNKHAGLALAGNGYHGIGIPDCIHSGENAADKVIRETAGIK